MFSKIRLAAVLALGTLLSPVVFAATITIVNNDLAGVGFNDLTVVAPVGGNTGTTLGQQRLNAFQAAAKKWGSTLVSTVPIRIQAQWTALSCTATSAVLGSAGATSIFKDFSGAPVAGHWYGKALANKLYGSDLYSAWLDISANFNVNLGGSNCLTGFPFYLGLDNNHGANIDLVTVLLHEFGHGLGFQTFTSGSSGAQYGGYPSIWDDYLLDTSTGKTWTAMTNAERVTSALNTGKLVWTGTNTSAAAARVLQAGSPGLTVYWPASVEGRYLVGTAAFGPALNSPGIYGEVIRVVDSTSGGPACGALSARDAAAVYHRIALIDRGVCTFKAKVVNAQAAGAVAVIIADTVAEYPIGLGNDSTISTPVSIPSVLITLANANALKAVLAIPSMIVAHVGIDVDVRAGADASGRPVMYGPNPFQSGSSVSHWDVSAFPNQLMEPNINGDLTHAVKPPYDLTAPLLKDIGWDLATDLTPILMLLLD
jgi:hypothetical protein